AAPAGTLGRRQPRQRNLARSRVAGWREGGKFAKWQDLPGSTATQQGGNPGGAGEAIEPAGRAQPSWMGEQAVEKQRAHPAVPAILRRCLRPRHFHDCSELHTGRADRLAGPAVEALVDERLKAWVVERHQAE